MSRQRSNRKRTTKRTRRKKSGRGCLPHLVGIAFFCFLSGGAAGTIWLYREYQGICTSPCVDLARLEDYRPEEGSTVFDRNGTEIGILYKTNRRVIPLRQMPPHLPSAFIAVEDRRFYEHDGIDVRRVFGALAANIQRGRVVEGFSTITMQLARNAFPEDLPYTNRTLARKLKEVRTAREIERRFTKDEILYYYLNTIYLGAGAYGVEAAARAYFGKSAAQLEPEESAMLAAIPKNPSRYDPYRNPLDALRRRNLVLRIMLETGAIDSATYVRAVDRPIRLAYNSAEEAMRAINKAPYFIEEIRKSLQPHFGDALYSSGLRIHTTLDASLQAYAEQALEAQLSLIEEGAYGRFAGRTRYERPDRPAPRDNSTPYLQGALVLMDIRNGDVLALVGGRDFADSKFNRATQARRQAGSAFKPIVYATAIELGVSPLDSINDGRLVLRESNGELWMPRNFGDDPMPEIDWISVGEALRRSKNRASIRLAMLSGLDRVSAMAKRLGLSGEFPTYPSIALGVESVTLLELVSAYSAFGRIDGNRVMPRFIHRITTRDGRVIWEQPAQSRSAVGPEVAFVMREMLRDVIENGTGRTVRIRGYDGPAAGKTGTTNDAADLWFVGFTPRYVAGIWIGFDTPRPVLNGTAASGGTLAAPVWAEVIKHVTRMDTTEMESEISWDEVSFALPAPMRIVAGCPRIDPNKRRFEMPTQANESQDLDAKFVHDPADIHQTIEAREGDATLNLDAELEFRCAWNETAESEEGSDPIRSVGHGIRKLLDRIRRSIGG